MKDFIGFEIVDSKTMTDPLGTKRTGVRTVRCPECGATFDQHGIGGCFSMTWIPTICPQCNYPASKLKGWGDDKDD